MTRATARLTPASDAAIIRLAKQIEPAISVAVKVRKTYNAAEIAYYRKVEALEKSAPRALHVFVVDVAEFSGLVTKEKVFRLGAVKAIQERPKLNKTPRAKEIIRVGIRYYRPLAPLEAKKEAAASAAVAALDKVQRIVKKVLAQPEPQTIDGARAFIRALMWEDSASEDLDAPPRRGHADDPVTMGLYRMKLALDNIAHRAAA
jgi:hypothetical protein